MDRNNDFENTDATSDSLRSANDRTSGDDARMRRADDLSADKYDRDALGADDAAHRSDAIGETTGGLAGALTGAALGSLGGPIGTIIGGIAGAVGGWWSGKEISIAASRYSDEDDEYYRSHYESSRSTSTDREVTDSARRADDYDTRRPAYLLGHIAGQNPEYSGRDFDEVEPDLQRGWSDDLAARHGDWNANRDYARSAYAARRSSSDAMNAAGTSATPNSMSSSAANTLASAAPAPAATPANSAATAPSTSGVTNTATTSASSGMSSTGASAAPGASASSAPPSKPGTPGVSAASPDASSGTAPGASSGTMPDTSSGTGGAFGSGPDGEARR